MTMKPAKVAHKIAPKGYVGQLRALRKQSRNGKVNVSKKKRRRRRLVESYVYSLCYANHAGNKSYRELPRRKTDGAAKKVAREFIEKEKKYWGEGSKIRPLFITKTIPM